MCLECGQTQHRVVPRVLCHRVHIHQHEDMQPVPATLDPDAKRKMCSQRSVRILEMYMISSMHPSIKVLAWANLNQCLKMHTFRIGSLGKALVEGTIYIQYSSKLLHRILDVNFVNLCTDLPVRKH